MGGISVLLAVATIGVTYGWQPDGSGGVEYIVQVAPEQLAQIRESGEITSTIDPSIQGHVSRVVIKVGNDPLPRRSVDLDARDNVYAAADHAPISAPQINTAHVDDGPQAVMKPDIGMQLPGSFAGAADRAKAGAADTMNNLRDRVGTATDNLANTAADRARSAGAGVMSRTSNALQDMLKDDRTRSAANGRSASDGRTAMNQQVPGFTGNNTAEPADARTRDNSWFDMKTGRRRTPSTSANSNADSRMPELMGPPAPRQPMGQQDDRRFQTAQSGLNTQLTASREQDSSQRRETGLGSTSTFARVPSGINIPNQRQNQNTRQNDSSRDSRLSLDNLRSNSDDQSRQNVPQRPTTTGINTRTNTGSGFGLPSTNAVDTRTQDAQNYWAKNQQPTRTLGNPANDNAQISSENLAAKRLRDGEVAPHLTMAQVQRLPAGAWSYDAHGNPIDRHNRVLDRYGRLVNQNAPANMANPATQPQNPGYTQNTNLRNPNFQNPNYQNPNYQNPNQNTGNPGYQPDPRLAAAPTYVAPTYRAPQYQPPQQASMVPSGLPSVPSANSIQPRRAETSPRETDSTKRSVVAQPVFNVFLLISIVGNVFLALLLNNLRYRFRDLVASKRMATAELPA